MWNWCLLFGGLSRKCKVYKHVTLDLKQILFWYRMSNNQLLTCILLRVQLVIGVNIHVTCHFTHCNCSWKESEEFIQILLFLQVSMSKCVIQSRNTKSFISSNLYYAYLSIGWFQTRDKSIVYCRIFFVFRWHSTAHNVGWDRDFTVKLFRDNSGCHDKDIWSRFKSLSSSWKPW